MNANATSMTKPLFSLRRQHRSVLVQVLVNNRVDDMFEVSNPELLESIIARDKENGVSKVITYRLSGIQESWWLSGFGRTKRIEQLADVEAAHEFLLAS